MKTENKEMLKTENKEMLTKESVFQLQMNTSRGSYIHHREYRTDTVLFN